MKILWIVRQDLSCYVFFISSSWFLLRPNDVTSTFCSFVHAISTELHAWRHFSLLVERFFCSFAWLSFWSHLTYLPLSKMISSLWNWLLFTLIQRDKVKWVCVTLNEGYLRSANRGSKRIKNWRLTDIVGVTKSVLWTVCYIQLER